MIENKLREFFTLVILATVLISGCSDESTMPEPNGQIIAQEIAQEFTQEIDNSFSIVMLPDTQNAVDYQHQIAEGFAIDSGDIYLAQMQDIAARSRENGGNLAFVASVGDVWQHQTIEIDADHAARGFSLFDGRIFGAPVRTSDKALTVEIPLAIEGYQFLDDADIPFGVVPGNHDYDARWYQTELITHLGGLENFLSAFGADSNLYKDKPWYIGSYNGGTSSAQRFSAGAYTFLHLSLEMHPSDEVLAWAQYLINFNVGLPTIITTHDFLNPQGERQANSVDLASVDPDHHNTAEQIWEKLIRKNDQIFMVLSGHQRGAARRIDLNEAGNQVYQMMADYQDRGQASLDVNQALNTRGNPEAIGDAWYRIMDFDMQSTVPSISVTTYSSHYKVLSSELETYASWYKRMEQPDKTDSEFYADDEFKIALTDFRQRFGPW